MTLKVVYDDSSAYFLRHGDPLYVLGGIVPRTTAVLLLQYCRCTIIVYTLRVHGVFVDVIFLMCAVLYYYCSCCRIGSRLCLRGRGLHLLSIFFLLLYRPRAGKVQRTTSVVLCINTTTCCATLLRRWRGMCVRLLPRRSCLLSYHKHHHVLPGI